MSDLPSIAEALALVLAHVRVLDAEDVAVSAANGRVLARDARATVDLPPFPSSAMDGYAVRAADTPGRPAIVGQSSAGSPFRGELSAGETVVISTGAVVPAGADAVVPVERSAREGEVVVLEAATVGAHVRPRGGDVRSGELVVAAGARLGPAQLGALAAVGVASVVCTRRARVVVLPTGNELRRAGEQLGAGQIYEANSVLLAAQLDAEGADVEVLPPVADEGNAIREALAGGLAADVLITSGGVSVGPHDLVRGGLADLGAHEIFWRVAVKPGKPVAFAVRGSTIVFGLPGNPVSSLVDFELFVRPALRALHGAAPGPFYLPGRLARPVRRTPDRDELLRARAQVTEAVVELDPLGGQDSHMIARAAAADALVLVPRGTGELAAGTAVRYLAI